MEKPRKIMIAADADLSARIEAERKRMEAESGLNRVPVSGVILSLVRRGLEATSRKGGGR
ncbi:hypothetical protein PUH89_06620 [Rhodobacter capsulatus]|uniref:Uncharacterized protein n=1 Tax=Rhodobacter capsulatus TaxID=1061 RepID=A0A1G7LN68_RHOCA|nr:hypothetical protein [Rhodobacter capsulatus]WER10641.1 hypothetical protein PUH89_06620 [Rhodobacter capsulatus]SDF50945.1 hypothetical protein SAMN04244550_02352 [Rhodobacter capsulatus]